MHTVHVFYKNVRKSSGRLKQTMAFVFRESRPNAASLNDVQFDKGIAQ